MSVADTTRVDWSDALGRLAKELARTLPRALLTCWLIIGLFAALNFLFGAVFFVVSGLAGGGHGSVALLPLAQLPFAPWAFAIGVWAKGQAARRVLAGAVGSQGELLACVAERLVAQFLAGPGAGAGPRIDRAWRGYVAAQRTLPGSVKLVLARLWPGRTLAVSLAAAAEKGIAPAALPGALVADALRALMARREGPRAKIVVALLGANLLWFALVMGPVAWLRR
jgi:hypothetical protein